MPIYEYECKTCQKVIEVIQSISEKPLTVCPECKGAVTKLVSMSSFHLKGGGWYADGYASNSTNGGNASTDKKNGTKKGAAKAETAKEKSAKTAVNKGDGSSNKNKAPAAA